MINLNVKQSKGTHWVSLFIDRHVSVYFDSFGIEYIPQELLSKIKDKFNTHNIFRMQDYDFIVCGFYCIAFIEYCIAFCIRFLYSLSILLYRFLPMMGEVSLET